MLIVLIDISDPRKIFKTCGIVVIVNHLISSESASKLLKVNLGAASISIEYDIFYDWKIDGFIEFTNGDNDFAWILRITKSIDGTICIIVWVIGERISRSTRIEMSGYFICFTDRVCKYHSFFELFDTCFICHASTSDEILHEFFGISWKLHALKEVCCFTEDSFLLSVMLLLLCLGYEEFERSHLRLIRTHIRHDVIVYMWSIPRGKIFW